MRNTIHNTDVTAYDPVSGKQLWQVECLDGEVAPSPAFNGKDILFVANEYAQATAIKLTGESPRIMWRYGDYLPEIASPLVAGGLVFIPTSYGDVVCLDEGTGKELWVQHFDVELRSSPIQVGDRVYLIDFEGVVHIFKVARSYVEVATIEMGERVHATPAFDYQRRWQVRHSLSDRSKPGSVHDSVQGQTVGRIEMLGTVGSFTRQAHHPRR